MPLLSIFISVVEPKIFPRLPPALAPRSRKSELRLRFRLQLRLQIVLSDTKKITFIDLCSRIKIVKIYKNIFSKQARAGAGAGAGAVARAGAGAGAAAAIRNFGSGSRGGNLISASLLSAPALLHRC